MTLPPYINFPTLSGTNVFLRNILDTDIKDLIEISYYDAIQATTMQEAAAMQVKINKDYAAGNSIHWGIVAIQTNKIVGTCGYYRGFENEKGELGCVLLPIHQGKGYMTTAMALAIEFGMNNIGLKCIGAITTSKNIKAIQLLERLNFKMTGLLEGDEIEYELR